MAPIFSHLLLKVRRFPSAAVAAVVVDPFRLRVVPAAVAAVVDPSRLRVVPAAVDAWV